MFSRPPLQCYGRKNISERTFSFAMSIPVQTLIHLDLHLGHQRIVHARGAIHGNHLACCHVPQMVTMLNPADAAQYQLRQVMVLAGATLALVMHVAGHEPARRVSLVENLGRSVHKAKVAHGHVRHGITVQVHAVERGTPKERLERHSPGSVAGARAAEDIAPVHAVALGAEVEHRELRRCSAQGVPGKGNTSTWSAAYGA
mmetsp:Transcript_33147/g.91619  ORF Transcript_33147/g.91619 Transcript_33147/m.91619 type:complete len:201 (-) Transcript_33147:533-1135(-)